MDDQSAPDVAVVTQEARSLSELAEAVVSLTRAMGTQDETPAVQRLLEHGASAVMGARWGSVTLLRQGRFSTAASTCEEAGLIAAAQYRFGSGPCVDPLVDGGTVVTPDISTEARWQPLGSRLREEFGLRSVVSYRLQLLDDSEVAAGLTFASERPDAFSTHHVHRGLVLASHAALLVAAQAANTKADQLMRALDSNREIGVAVGVLMAQHTLTREQAFTLLRAASQNTNRKLADIATDVADTGLAPRHLPAVVAQ